MAKELVTRTFEQFWGELLFVRFHESGTPLWSLNEKRARWVLDSLPDTPQPHILDLGCGNGVLDILLGRHGARVTAVDQMQIVLNHAQNLLENEAVTFVYHDLRQLQQPSAAYDAVLILGLTGLMSRADDAALIAKARQWLMPAGRLLIDCQAPPDEQQLTWSREFPDGMLQMEVIYNPQTRLLWFNPTFETDGTLIVLHDPYDKDKPNETGFARYLYPKQELVELIAAAGFSVQEEHHIFEDDYLFACS
jgi:SAM-dependent methyltransferase